MHPPLSDYSSVGKSPLIGSYGCSTSTEISEDSSSAEDQVRLVADSTTSSFALAFQEGEDVLWRSQDGLLFLGVIVEVELESASCLVRFGDCTERWAHFGDLRRLDEDDDQPPSPGLVKVNGCENSLVATPPSLPKFSGLILSHDKGVVPDHVLQARKELPYDFDSLLWDENHQRNDKERYCYCGESGDWYRKMLQCNHCLQWFHQDCIRTAHTNPLLLGDRFFDFVCTICTGTCEEVLRRIDLTLTDALHLVLFNLTVINSKKYHNLESSIIPFMKSRWKNLQGPGNILKLGRLEPHFLSELLNAHKSRFRSGSDSRKRNTFWGLRKVAPPMPPPMGNLTLTNSSLLTNTDNGSGGGQRWKPKKKSVQASGSTTTGSVQPGSVRKSAATFQLKSSAVLAARTGLKRGRPARHGGTGGTNRPRDSLDSCSDASSSGSLETWIPFPPNFDGYNNPFRDVDNCLRRIPEKRSKVESEKSPKAEEDSEISVVGQENSSNNVVIPILKNRPIPEKKPGGIFDTFQTPLSSIFGLKSFKERVAMVCAKRVTLDGSVEYLVESVL